MDKERVKIGEYVLETLQIYFPCSLELQEELIRYGFKVPIKTPIPIIYGNYKGYEEGKESPGPQKQAVIHPSRYGKSLSEMGWQEFSDFYKIPKEHGAILRLEIEGEGHDTLLHLILKFYEPKPNYHLERISYRNIEPSKWKNWAMFYIDIRDLESIITNLYNKIRLDTEVFKFHKYITHEKQQGEQEDSYFFSLDKSQKNFGVPIDGYSICLGCFEHVLSYFNLEATKYGGESIERCRLRLFSSGIKPFAKIGFSKMVNKHPQFMFKLVSNPNFKKEIIKLDGKKIIGKARGDLIFCDHMNKKNEITMNASLFLQIALWTNEFYKKFRKV